MAELRRTRVGPYDESTMFTLQDLKDAYTLHQEGNDKFLKKIIQPFPCGPYQNSGLITAEDDNDGIADGPASHIVLESISFFDLYLPFTRLLPKMPI